MAPARKQDGSKFFHEEMSTIDVRDIWEVDTIEPGARVEVTIHPPPRVGGSAAEVKLDIDQEVVEVTLDL